MKLLNWKKFIVCSDSHGDSCDKNAVKKFLDFNKQFNADIKVHAGDLFDFRGMRGKASEEERAQSMEEDFQSGLQLLEQYNPNYYLKGNHCDRLDRLSESNNGMIRDAANGGLKVINQICQQKKIKILPYHKRDGILKIGHLKILHGFYCGMMAAKQHALVYGSCLFGHVHCFPVSAEVATKTGWKNRSQLLIGEEILTYNMSKQCAEWGIVSDIADGFSDEMASFQYSKSEMFFTPNHDMVAKTIINGGSFSKRKAESLTKSTTVMPCAAIVDKCDYPISDDLLMLLGWITTEGHFGSSSKIKRKYISISQSDKPKVGVKRITDIIDRLLTAYPDTKYTVSRKHLAGENLCNYDNYRICLHQGSLTNEILRLIPNKEVDAWMIGLSKRQVDILLNELVLADGYFPTKNLCHFYSNKEREIDILQLILISNGYRCIKDRRPPDSRFKDIKPMFALHINRHQHKRFQPCKIIKTISQPIWCPSVTPNQTIFVRQGGKVIITGNTIEEYAIPRMDRTVARSIGCLAKLDMQYNKAMPSSLRHTHGFAYGVVNPKSGAYFTVQAECIDGQWFTPNL